MFLSKLELKNQLINLGIKVEGNYIRKCDLEKFFEKKTLAADKAKAIIDFNESQISRANTLYVPIYTSADRDDLDKIYALQFIPVGNRRKMKVLIHLYKQDGKGAKPWLLDQVVPFEDVKKTFIDFIKTKLKVEVSKGLDKIGAGKFTVNINGNYASKIDELISLKFNK